MRGILSCISANPLPSFAPPSTDASTYTLPIRWILTTYRCIHGFHSREQSVPKRTTENRESLQENITRYPWQRENPMVRRNKYTGTWLEWNYAILCFSSFSFPFPSMFLSIFIIFFFFVLLFSRIHVSPIPSLPLPRGHIEHYSPSKFPSTYMHTILVPHAIVHLFSHEQLWRSMRRDFLFPKIWISEFELKKLVTTDSHPSTTLLNDASFTYSSIHSSIVHLLVTSTGQTRIPQTYPIAWKDWFFRVNASHFTLRTAICYCTNCTNQWNLLSSTVNEYSECTRTKFIACAHARQRYSKKAKTQANRSIDSNGTATFHAFHPIPEKYIDHEIILVLIGNLVAG